jgi:hypothetical protein
MRLQFPQVCDRFRRKDYLMAHSGYILAKLGGKRKETPFLSLGVNPQWAGS